MKQWSCPKCSFATLQPDSVGEVTHPCGVGRDRVQRALKMIEPPVVNIRHAIVTRALARFPEEACGLILDTGTVVLADNVSPDPKQSFLIDPEVVKVWWPTGRVVGIWHSHCFDGPEPSAEDVDGTPDGIDCWIYSVLGEQLNIYRKARNGLKLISSEELCPAV